MMDGRTQPPNGRRTAAERCGMVLMAAAGMLKAAGRFCAPRPAPPHPPASRLFPPRPQMQHETQERASPVLVLVLRLWGVVVLVWLFRAAPWPAPPPTIKGWEKSIRMQIDTRMQIEMRRQIRMRIRIQKRCASTTGALARSLAPPAKGVPAKSESRRPQGHGGRLKF